MLARAVLFFFPLLAKRIRTSVGELILPLRL